MIYMSVFSWISTIVSILCVVWLIGLAVFVLVRSIVLKVKNRKEMKEDLTSYQKSKNRKLGIDDDE